MDESILALAWLVGLAASEGQLGRVSPMGAMGAMGAMVLVCTQLLGSQRVLLWTL